MENAAIEGNSQKAGENGGEGGKLLRSLEAHGQFLSLP